MIEGQLPKRAAGNTVGIVTCTRSRRHLRAETGDGDIYRYFQIAGSLHENFYENQMAAQDI